MRRTLYSSLVLSDECVLQRDCRAKYAAAFFRMSRSSVTRLSSAFRRRSSSLWLSCWVRAASGIWRSRTHLYRLWVLTPRRLENWPDIDEDLSTEGLLRGARAPQAGLRS